MTWKITSFAKSWREGDSWIVQLEAPREDLTDPSGLARIHQMVDNEITRISMIAAGPE